MTVTSGIASATYVYTGVETQITPGFQAAETSDVSVSYLSGSTKIPLANPSNFTVQLDANNLVTVVIHAFPPAPATIILERNSTPLQETTFQDGVPWSASAMGQGLDLAAFRDQELRRDVSELQVELPAEVARAEGVEAAINNAVAALQALATETWQNFITGSSLALPTTLPQTTGTFWNNGGALCVTPGGANALPTVLPSAPGLIWNDGGFVCIS